jgi:segregation and condensation protein B
MGDREVVESALFAAGRPLDETVIARATGLPEAAVREHLRALAATYSERGSALEVALVAGKWTLQLRPDYADRAKAFAQPELDREVIKTAALIAYHQPLAQSKLVDMVGDRAYEHVRVLAERNLVVSKPSGRTVELTTSRYFPEFFGLQAKDPVEIKRYLASLAGRTGVPKGLEPPRTTAAAAD